MGLTGIRADAGLTPTRLPVEHEITDAPAISFGAINSVLAVFSSFRLSVELGAGLHEAVDRLRRTALSGPLVRLEKSEIQVAEAAELHRKEIDVMPLAIWLQNPQMLCRFGDELASGVLDRLAGERINRPGRKGEEQVRI